MMFLGAFLRTTVLALLGFGIGASDAPYARTVSAFNVQAFGQSKIGKPAVVGALVRVLGRYDLCAVQEVRDKSGEAVVQLLDALNEGRQATQRYALLQSERLGRTRFYKEQVAFFYREDRIKLLAHATVGDPTDAWERPPVVAWWDLQPDADGVDSHSSSNGSSSSSSNRSSSSSVLATLVSHVDPDAAVAEMDALASVLDAVAAAAPPYDRHRAGAGALLLGDLNADCAYFPASRWRCVRDATCSSTTMRLWAPDKYEWPIGDDADTTTGSTDCAYDRFVWARRVAGGLRGVNGAYDVPAAAIDGVGVHNFTLAQGLTSAEAREVSDHLPVELTLLLPAPPLPMAPPGQWRRAAQPYRVLRIGGPAESGGLGLGLGVRNASAAADNPFRGFVAAPAWQPPATRLSELPAGLEFHYIPLRAVMNHSGTPAAVRAGLARVVEPMIADSALRAAHSVLRFYLDYPAMPTGMPHFLTANTSGVIMRAYGEHGGGTSPDYSDERLLGALDTFIATLGAQYDGDPRLGFVQAGLLGFWGEWHTYPHNTWLPDAAKVRVIAAFARAFRTTQWQLREPHAAARSLLTSQPGRTRVGVGLHDDSFAYSTLDGVDNGGKVVPWFFWPTVIQASFSESWRTAATGGEVRPELQRVLFDGAGPGGYAAGTEYKQDFLRCVNVTRASYMLNHFAFDRAGGGYGGSARPPGTLARARAGANMLGYRFVVSSVAAYAHEPEPGDRAQAGHMAAGGVSIHVNVTNEGVAPFYYPLSLALRCANWRGSALTRGGVERVMPGATATFTYAFAYGLVGSGGPTDGAAGARAAQTCLNEGLLLSLRSNVTFAGRPVRFAQTQPGVRANTSAAELAVAVGHHAEAFSAAAPSPPTPLPSPPQQPSPSGGDSSSLVIASAAGAILVVTFVALQCWRWCRRRSKRAGAKKVTAGAAETLAAGAAGHGAGALGAPGAAVKPTAAATAPGTGKPTSTLRTAGDGSPPLPPGWLREVDGNGRTYFTNRATGESSWAHPGSQLPDASADFSDVLTGRKNNKYLV